MKILDGVATDKRWFEEEHMCNTCTTRVLFERDDEDAINAKLAAHGLSWWQVGALQTLPFDCPVCGKETRFGPTRIWRPNNWARASDAVNSEVAAA